MNDALQQSHSRFLSKAIMSGLRGYLEAKVMFAQAKDAREQAILKRNMDNKAQELRDMRLLANQKDLASHQAELEEGAGLRQTEASIEAAGKKGIQYSEDELKSLYATGKLPTAAQTQQSEFKEASTWWDTEYQRLNKDLPEGAEPQLPLGMTKEEWLRERKLLTTPTEPTPSASEIDQQKRDNELTDAYQQIMKTDPPKDVDINTAIGRLPTEIQEKIFEAVRQLTGKEPSMEEKLRIQDEFDQKKIQRFMEAGDYSYMDAAVRAGYAKAGKPSVDQLFNKILPDIKKHAKDANWNLTPLQMLQIATGQNITEDEGGTFAEYQQTLEMVQSLRGLYPDIFPADLQDWQIAFAWHGKGKELMSAFRSQARDNFFDDPAIVPDYVETKFQGRSKQEIMETEINPAFRAAFDKLATQLSDGNPKVKSEHLGNLIESYEHLLASAEPDIALVTVAESMLSDAVHGTLTASERQEYGGRLAIAEEVLKLEKALLTLHSDYDKKRGFRQDRVVAAFQAVGMDMPESVRLNMSLDDMVTLLAQQYRVAITGKAFRQEEMQEILRLLPSSGQPFKNNIAKIHTWLDSINTDMKVLLVQKFGSDFADLIPDFYRIGYEGEPDPETGVSTYYPSSRAADPQGLRNAKDADNTTDTKDIEQSSTDNATDTKDAKQNGADNTTTTTETTTTEETSERDKPVESPEIAGASDSVARVRRQEGQESETGAQQQQRLSFAKRLDLIGKIADRINQQDSTPQEKQQSINAIGSQLRRRGYDPNDIAFITAELQKRAGITENVPDDFRNATDPTQIRGRMNRGSREPEKKTEESPPVSSSLSTTTRDKLKTSFRGAEGFRDKPYDDMGQQAIGYGFRMDQWGLDGVENMTQEEAEAKLDEIIDVTYNEAKSVFGDKFDGYDERRKAAIIEIIYNLGLTDFLDFEDTIRFIKEEKWNEASGALMNSEAARLLTGRYMRLARMLSGGGD